MRANYVAQLGVVLCTVTSVARDKPQFPEWRPTPLRWDETWLQSPTIIIGDLREIRSFGVQRVHKRPPPEEAVRQIYWCEGEFTTQLVIRGKRPSAGKKLVWGSGFPGCELRTYTSAPGQYHPVSQLWFVREEAEYVRPYSDMRFRFVFNGVWGDLSGSDPQTKFALLFFNPHAKGESPKEFAADFFASAGTVCFSLLSEAECKAQVRRAGAHGDSDLRDAACRFLHYYFKETCSPSNKGSD